MSKNDIESSFIFCILIKLKNNKYIFISGNIYEFVIPSNIVSFTALNNFDNIPFPILITENEILFLFHQTYINRVDIDKSSLNKLLLGRLEEQYQLYCSLKKIKKIKLKYKHKGYNIEYM